jgi:hypothetical protein
MDKESVDRFALLSDKTELIYLIDKLLTDLLSETKNLEKSTSGFDCKDVPAISVLDYLKSKECFSKEFANMLTVRKACSWQL